MKKIKNYKPYNPGAFSYNGKWIKGGGQGPEGIHSHLGHVVPTSLNCGLKGTSLRVYTPRLAL